MSIVITKQSVVVPVLDSGANAIELKIYKQHIIKKDLVAVLTIPDENTVEPIYDLYVSQTGVDLINNDSDNKRKQLVPLLTKVFQTLEKAAHRADASINTMTADGLAFIRKQGKSADAGLGVDDKEKARALADQIAAMQTQALSVVNNDNPYDIIGGVAQLLKKLRDYRQQWIDLDK